MILYVLIQQECLNYYIYRHLNRTNSSFMCKTTPQTANFFVFIPRVSMTTFYTPSEI